MPICLSLNASKGFLSNLRCLTRRVPEDAIGNSWQRELWLEIVDGTKSRLLFRYTEYKGHIKMGIQKGTTYQPRNDEKLLRRTILAF